jgi:hypothetical protein
MALAFVICARTHAPAVVQTAYQSTGAFVIEQNQELDGKPIENGAQEGWTVPVVFPRDIFHRPQATRVTVMWEALDSAPAGVPEVIVDGRSVGPAESFGRTGFIKTVQLSRLMLSDMHHQVLLRLMKGANLFLSTGNTIVLHPVSPFILIEPTFRHDRCSNCHSLQSSQAIRDYHNAFEVELPDDPDVVPGKSVICMGCHDPSLTGVSEWMSPATDRAPNFRLVPGTRALCERIVEVASMRLTRDPPFDFIAGHFRNDQRIHWALESGKVPLDLPPLPKAPPFSSELFGDLADRWVFWGRFGKFCDGLE